VSFSLMGEVTAVVTAGLKFLLTKYSPVVPASPVTRTRYVPVTSGWYCRDSLRPSPAATPEATRLPEGSNRSRCGVRMLTNWSGGWGGVVVGSCRVLAVLATFTEYQSASPVATKSKRVTRPLWNADPDVSLTEPSL